MSTQKCIWERENPNKPIYDYCSEKEAIEIYEMWKRDKRCDTPQQLILDIIAYAYDHGIRQMKIERGEPL